MVLIMIDRSEEMHFLGARIIGNCLQIRLINEDKILVIGREIMK